jgi:hypothetical protein
MSLAVPSVAEASRHLPSVKPPAPPADDEIVTSVAFSATAVPERLSPELALVDPELAARARALLPEPVDTVAPRAEAISTPEPLEELESLARPTPAAEDDREQVTASGPAASNVRLLRPATPAAQTPPASVGAVEVEPITQPQPRPELETVPSPAAAPAAAPPAPPFAAPQAHGRETGVERLTAATRPLVLSLRDVAADHRRLLVAFAAGAVAASFVVVGVIAALGESDGGQVGGAQGGTPSLVPPSVVAPAPPSATSSTGAAKKQAAAGGKTSSAKQSAATAKKNAATAKKKAGAAKEAASTTTAAAPPARRFAWAPVDGAVGYRVELFRGDEQVLRASTKQPVYELPGSWRHNGRAERLSPGSYRWYVWPVLASGPTAEAVVQARLNVP